MPSFPQNPWVPFYTFQKSVGSAEPTEATLTTPLIRQGEAELSILELTSVFYHLSVYNICTAEKFELSSTVVILLQL